MMQKFYSLCFELNVLYEVFSKYELPVFVEQI